MKMTTLEYIHDYWQKIIFKLSKDKGVFIGLPHSFVSPNDKFFAHLQFYWDSYFIIRALLRENKVRLAKGIVENLVYLYKRFGLIPSSNRFFNLNASQPPFLTSMIKEVYEADKSKGWLKKMAASAEDELADYWQNEEHLVYKGLSRYFDYYLFSHHHLAEQEAGWDFSSRFRQRGFDVLPVDLNCLLYKYESDLAEIYVILKNNKKADFYKGEAEQRKASIQELMWDEEPGFFFDYDFKDQTSLGFWSLAGFYPLWVKLAGKEQAGRALKALDVFEQEWGLANTKRDGLDEEFRQHDWPNGWPQQHLIAVEGLLNYGFVKEAVRIIDKWISLNDKIFQETGFLWEKYNVVEGAIGKSDRYETQPGFAWTNAVYLLFQDYIKKIK